MKDRTIVEAPLSWSEAIKRNMWKFMGNVQSSHYRVKKLRNSIILQVVDYLQVRVLKVEH